MTKTMTCNFSLGDRVTSKKTGKPMTGTIISILCPIYWCASNKHVPGLFEELYPDWKEKPLYIVLFDSPQRHITREEFFKGREDLIGNRLIEMEFALLPAMSNVAYPEDDLEKL